MLPSNSKWWRCENDASLRGSLLNFQELKMHWCKASFKFRELKMWNRSFDAMFPSNSKSWRCDNDALVRCCLQIPGVKEMWKRSFGAMILSNCKSWSCEQISSTHQFQCTKCLYTCKAQIIAQHHQRREEITWNHQFHCARVRARFHKSDHARKRRALEPTFLRSGSSVYLKKHHVSCKPYSSHIVSMIRENEDLVQSFVQIPSAEDVKTKLWCDVSFQFPKLKMWKRGFGAMFPSKFKSARCELSCLLSSALLYSLQLYSTQL